MTARPPRAHRPAMLTVTQAADRLGVSRMQAYRWVASGILAHVTYPTGNGKPNGPIRIEENAIDAFIAAHRQEATT